MTDLAASARAALVARGRMFLSDADLALVEAGALTPETARVLLTLELSTDQGELAAVFDTARHLLPAPAAPTVADAMALLHSLGQRQVILATWDGHNAHLVTAGRTPEDAAQAADGSHRIQAALRWPESLAQNPPRVQALLDKIAELEARLEAAPTTPQFAVHVLPLEGGCWRAFADGADACAWVPGERDPAPVGVPRLAHASTRVFAMLEAAGPAGVTTGRLDDLLRA